jgi:hypothetical protein
MANAVERVHYREKAERSMGKPGLAFLATSTLGAISGV